MSSSWRLLATAVLVVALCSIVQAAQVPRSDLMGAIRRFCLSSCENLLKDESLCPLFCRFCDHVESSHGDQVVHLWERSGRQAEPLKYSMNDLVRWKFETKSDDDHAIAERYQQLIEEWYRRLADHDEL